MALHTRNTLEKTVLHVVRIRNGDSVLDVGCGIGTFAIFTKLRFPGSTVIGLDPNEEALAKAKSAAFTEKAQVEFVQGVAQKIPYKVGVFDVVVSSLTFHHLSGTAKKRAIREIYRVLKPQGVFYLADFGKPGNIFGDIMVRVAAFLEPGTYFRDHLEGNIPVFLEQTGFTVHEAHNPYFGIRFWKAVKNHNSRK